MLIVGALMGAARLKQLKDSPTSRSTIEDAIRVAVSMARTLAAVCTLTFTMALMPATTMATVHSKS